MKIEQQPLVKTQVMQKAKRRASLAGGFASAGGGVLVCLDPASGGRSFWIPVRGFRRHGRTLILEIPSRGNISREVIFQS